MDKQKLLSLINTVKHEGEIVVSTLREKGSSRFGRPILGALVVVLVSYQALYVPPQKKLRALQNQIKSAQAVATYADEYMSIRDQIAAVHRRLPAAKDKDAWLFNKVRETLVQDNLVAENLAPPTANEDKGVAYQRMGLALEVGFPQLALFVQRLESVKPFIHVASIDLTKETDDKLGRNKVNFEITTVIPTRRPG